jgi:hypothetical protein
LVVEIYPRVITRSQTLWFDHLTRSKNAEDEEDCRAYQAEFIDKLVKHCHNLPRENIKVVIDSYHTRTKTKENQAAADGASSDLAESPEKM